MTSLLAAGDGGPAPAFQLLIYPVTDSAEEHRSYELFADGFFLTRRDMHWYQGHFLPPGTDLRDPRVSPLHAADVSGVAPAFVVTAGFDPLRDEGRQYADASDYDGVGVFAAGGTPWRLLTRLSSTTRPPSPAARSRSSAVVRNAWSARALWILFGS